MKRILEICCDTLQSVKNAADAGADRIELCSALSTGGITPTIGFLKQAKSLCNIPINILLRPRAGNFVYSDEEFKIMCADIEDMKAAGANGIVSGILLQNGEIDEIRTKILVELSKPLEFTFHRGLDFSTDIESGFESLIKIGAFRILSSGGSAKIDGGIENIIKFHKKYGDKIILMPGGGLNLTNAEKLKNAGITEFHFSASEYLEDNCSYSRKPDGLAHVFVDEKHGYNFSSKSRIQEMLNLLR
jgi:copper homeostasis protein